MPNQGTNIGIIDVPMDEILVVDETGADNHATLTNLDAPDQHPIAAIIGLGNRLSNIESIEKTIYSNRTNIANYYKWHDGISREPGYFVTYEPNKEEIKVCNKYDIFGVTVASAAFVGGQNALISRDSTYGLVATTGIVDVICGAEINVGDYVVSDENGHATKASTNCGYKVIARKEIGRVLYATISLGVQADTTEMLGSNVASLNTRVDGIKTNLDDTTAQLAALGMRFDSVASGSENAADVVEMLMMSVDMYSVGSLSPSYGLTLEQAKETLNNGMVYIPLQYDGKDTHEEVYGDEKIEFSYGAYYVWSSTGEWTAHFGKVWFGENQPGEDANTYDYWYYNRELYKYQDGQWSKIFSIAGNVNAQTTSILRQNVNGIEMRTTSLEGNYVSLQEQVTGQESKIGMVATFNEDGSVTADPDYTASIFAIANKSGTEIKLRADHISFDDGNGGEVKIDGSHIDAGSIKVNAAQIEGEITANHMDAVSGKVGGFFINENGIAKGDAGLNSEDYAVSFEDTYTVSGTSENGKFVSSYSIDENYNIVEIVSRTVAYEHATTVAVSSNDISFKGNTMFFDIEASSNASQTITVEVTYKYTQSPIRFFAGATDTKEVETTVTLEGSFNASGSFAGNLVAKEVLPTAPTSVVSYKLVKGSGEITGLALNTNSGKPCYMAVINGGEPEEDFAIEVVVHYLTADPETAKFITRNNGKITAKAISVEGNSNVGGIYVDATKGLFNKSTFAGSQCGILSNSDYYGYGSLSVDGDGRLKTNAWSPIYLFGGQIGDGLQDGSGREDLVPQLNTDNCNFYVTQSGLVNVKSLLCDGGVIGVTEKNKDDGNIWYHTVLSAGSLSIRDVSSNSSSGATTKYSVFGAEWTNQKGEIVGKISTNLAAQSQRMDVTGDWRFNKLHVVGTSSNHGNISIQNSDMYVQNNSSLQFDDSSVLSIKHSHDEGVTTYDVGDSLYSFETKIKEVINKINEMLTDKDFSADKLSQLS